MSHHKPKSQLSTWAWILQEELFPLSTRSSSSLKNISQPVLHCKPLVILLKSNKMNISDLLNRESPPRSSSTPGIDAGAGASIVARTCPGSTTDKSDNDYIQSVENLALNDQVATISQGKPEPETVTHDHSHQPPVPRMVKRANTSSATTHLTVADKRLKLLLSTKSGDDFDALMEKIRAYQRQKSMRKCEIALARAYGTKDKREFVLSKQDIEDFDFMCPDHGIDIEEPPEEKQSPNPGERCSYHAQCPCRGKKDASCWSILAHREPPSLPSRLEGSYIPRHDISDLNLNPPLPRHLVTDYRKYSHTRELEHATTALINTVGHFEDVLPLEISIRIEALRKACEQEGDERNDSTLNAFAECVLEWEKMPGLDRKVARHVNGNFTFSGYLREAQGMLMHDYNGRLFTFNYDRMVQATHFATEDEDEDEEYLLANWPTYHWVVFSWIVTLATYCKIYHEQRPRNRDTLMPPDFVFPTPLYPRWAKWQLHEKWKCGTKATVRPAS